MTLFLNAAHGTQWPVLDNHHENPVISKNHKIILNSLLENAIEQKPGFKFKGHWFKVRGQIPGGNNYGMNQNNPLYQKAQRLKEMGKIGHRLQILPITPQSVYKDFNERCMYKCLLDGRDQGVRFRLYSADTEIDQLRHLMSKTSTENNTLVDVNESLLRHWVNRPLGRGGPLPQGQYGYVSPKISRELMAEKANHPILKHAFEFLKAADLADYQDPLILAHYMNVHTTPVTAGEVIGAIRGDMELLKQAQRMGINIDRSFKDQLSYPQKGSAQAIAYIHQYPQLLQGKLPNELKSLKGGRAQALLMAQYYIAAVAAKKGGHGTELKETLDQVGGLYRQQVPDNGHLKSLLSRSFLVQDGVFFTPAHNYVKHGDVIQEIQQNVAHLPNNIQATHAMQNIFTDCSGFACMILRKLFPENTWMQDHRAMSWQFAAAYDLLNGGEKFTQNGISRSLTPNEKKHLKNNRQTAHKLGEMLTPVKNTRNVRTGDILISRDPQGEHEGHVMIIVDPHPNPSNPNEVIIVEMTQAGFAGNRNGLIWRKTTLKNSKHHVNRILRPKIST